MDNKQMYEFLLSGPTAERPTPTPEQQKEWLAALLQNKAINSEICFDRRAYQLTVYVRLDVDELKK